MSEDTFSDVAALKVHHLKLNIERSHHRSLDKVMIAYAHMLQVYSSTLSLSKNEFSALLMHYYQDLFQTKKKYNLKTRQRYLERILQQCMYACVCVCVCVCVCNVHMYVYKRPIQNTHILNITEI